MNLRFKLESLSPRELIEALSIRIYEPPLSAVRGYLHEVAKPLRVLILVLDFDTEVSMNGVLGFLENSSGLYLADTIEAFDAIGAQETGEILRCIETTLQKHGVTPSRLRANFCGTEPYQITTFRKLHGDLGSIAKEVEHDAGRLYVYGTPDAGAQVWSLLEGFVEKNRQEFFAEIDRVSTITR